MEITISVDPAKLSRYSDGFLATAWHVAQANPAPHGDWEAADMVKQIGWEIIRRWLGKVEPEMYHHQADTNYHQWLTLFARYEPPDGNRPKALDPASIAEFHRGRWVPRSPEEIEAELAKRAVNGRGPVVAVPDAST